MFRFQLKSAQSKLQHYSRYFETYIVSYISSFSSPYINTFYQNAEIPMLYHEVAWTFTLTTYQMEEKNILENIYKSLPVFNHSIEDQNKVEYSTHKPTNLYKPYLFVFLGHWQASVKQG